MVAIRRTALAALTVVAASSLPQRVAAEGGHPLRTWCNSPTMDYCISLLAFEYVLAVNGPGESDILISVTLQGFGSALSAGRPFGVEELYFGFETGLGYAVDRVSDIKFFEPGEVATGREATNIPTPLRELTVDSFAWVEFREAGDPSVFDFCITSEEWATRFPGSEKHPICHRVPEPSSWLLLGSGLLGLGFVAWRRKEED